MSSKILALVILTLTASVLFMKQGSTDSIHSFDAWCARYNKHYSTVEQVYRAKMYAQNVATIIAHNVRFQQGLETYDLGLNQYADMPLDEFIGLYSGSLATPSESQDIQDDQHNMQAPESVDWAVSKNMKIRDEGNCVASYAFAVAGAVDTAIAIKKSTNIVELSPQQIINCLRSVTNPCGEGGSVVSTYGYVKDFGLVTDAEVPYVAERQPCSELKAPTKISGHKLIGANNQQAFIDALALGPVVAPINTTTVQFQFYKSGVFTGYCPGDTVNYDSLVVGYDNQSIKIKMTWGSTWGEQGYIRIGRDVKQTNGQCGVLYNPSYPLL